MMKITEHPAKNQATSVYKGRSHSLAIKDQSYRNVKRIIEMDKVLISKTLNTLNDFVIRDCLKLSRESVQELQNISVEEHSEDYYHAHAYVLGKAEKPSFLDGKDIVLEFTELDRFAVADKKGLDELSQACEFSLVGAQRLDRGLEKLHEELLNICAKYVLGNFCTGEKDVETDYSDFIGIPATDSENRHHICSMLRSMANQLVFSPQNVYKLLNLMINSSEIDEEYKQLFNGVFSVDDQNIEAAGYLSIALKESVAYLNMNGGYNLYGEFSSERQLGRATDGVNEQFLVPLTLMMQLSLLTKYHREAQGLVTILADLIHNKTHHNTQDISRGLLDVPLGDSEHTLNSIIDSFSSQLEKLKRWNHEDMESSYKQDYLKFRGLLEKVVGFRNEFINNVYGNKVFVESVISCRQAIRLLKRVKEYRHKPGSIKLGNLIATATTLGGETWFSNIENELQKQCALVVDLKDHITMPDRPELIGALVKAKDDMAQHQLTTTMQENSRLNYELLKAHQMLVQSNQTHAEQKNELTSMFMSQSKQREEEHRQNIEQLTDLIKNAGAQLSTTSANLHKTENALQEERKKTRYLITKLDEKSVANAPDDSEKENTNSDVYVRNPS